MFGGIRKRLQEAMKKVARAIEKKEVPPPREEKLPAEEKVETELERDAEQIRELEEKIHEEHIPEPVEESLKEEEEALQEEKAAEIRHELEKEEERKLAEELPPVLSEEKRHKVAHEMVRAEEKKEELILETLKEAVPEVKMGKKPRFGLLKKVTERVLTESDIEKTLKELEIALLENDVAVEVAERIGEGVKASLLGRAVKRGKVDEAIRNALKEAMRDVLSIPSIDIGKKIEEKKGEPLLILLAGFNGSGKTTTCARLAYRFKKYNPILAAGDTFRAASIEQLEEHGRRLGVEVVKHRYGADPAAVIFDAKKHAAAVGSRLVIADTAGRSHANANLMDELKKVVRVNRPDLKVLVLDALTGNDIYDQARLFNDAVGIDAIILTKADVYEKGGAALSAAYTIRKPVLFLGVGQDYKDLKEFDAEGIINAFLG